MIPLLWFLALIDLEALACLLWASLTPSESGQGGLLWLSRERLGLVGLVLLVFLALLIVTLYVLRRKDQAHQHLAGLDDLLIKGRFLAPTFIYLTILPALVAAAVALVLRTPLDYAVYRAWAPDTFPLLRSIVSASLPLLVLFVLLAFELAIFLGMRHRGVMFTASLWTWDVLGPALLVLLMVLSLAFHWLVLIFQLRFLVDIPGWYWIFAPVPFGLGDLAYVLGAVILFALAYWLLIVRRNLAFGLLLVVALGWFLQMGVGLMGGSGMATLRDRYFTTYHQAYVQKAAESSQTVFESIRQYNSLYGSNTFTTTKPPGLMAFYIALEHAVNGYPSDLEGPARYARFSNLITWLFPVLATTVVVLLCAVAGRLIQDATGTIARTAPLLYVLAPSVALFTFFADQALYPSLFLLGIWFAVSVIRRASLPWSIVLGIVLFAAAFFSFSMLPLYPFAALYLLLYAWKDQPAERPWPMLLTGVGIAVGTLVAYWFAATFLNYDFISHFQHMAAINHNFDFYTRVGAQPPAGTEPFAARLGQIARAAWFNNLDFAAAIGFPIYILFAVQAARRIIGLGRTGASPGAAVLLAWLLSFLLLNLAGTAQGEVPRLWLFWLPMVVLLAALELEPYRLRRPWLVSLLAGTQLVTLILTFHFQDLRM